MDEQRFFDDDEEDGEPSPSRRSRPSSRPCRPGCSRLAFPGHDDDGLRSQPAGSDVPDDVDEEVDVPGDAPTGPHRVACTLTLSEMELGHFDSIMRQEFCESLAEALAIDTDRITLVAARAGSVVVDAQVTVDDAEAATRLVSKLEDPAAALVDSKFGTCVITDVSSCPVDTLMSPSPSRPRRPSPTRFPGPPRRSTRRHPSRRLRGGAGGPRILCAPVRRRGSGGSGRRRVAPLSEQSVPPAPSRAEATPPLPNRADSDGGRPASRTVCLGCRRHSSAT